MTLNSRDGKKLVIGTETCNVLVHRSDSTDMHCRAWTQASRTSICRISRSTQCTIYLDEQRVHKALAIASKDATSATSQASPYQLRNRAQLDKETVFQLHGEANGRIQSYLKQIFDEFGDNEHVPIIHNNKLNEHLEGLTALLHPYLATAKSNVQQAINKAFSILSMFLSFTPAFSRCI
ncbi:hypothetical protein BCR43DRAFT_546464 [Syncephalastrum racemosum]|uniref:Uncharacterized protein n=1 Tax=Syncephalastrum racemosum TaxID=13706 RepID=A0A1X2HG19_SYNRA|nr:hypothetical protein BCR43DRAFT_546464 [Syncephalastrum racemosum]